MVDSLGIVISSRVEPANVSDQWGGKMLLSGIRTFFPNLKLIYADRGFAGDNFKQWANRDDYNIQIVKKEPASAKEKFKISAKRWIVERTFGWFNRYRRLAKDYEAKVNTSEVLIDLVMIRIMLNRLC